MGAKLTRVRGFQDLLPGLPTDGDGAGERALSAPAVSLVEERARRIAERHNISEIRLPVLERLELYQRSSGETSDVVEKQMFAFADRDEAQTVLALRPEGTPGVVRAYMEAGLDRSAPEQRFYYAGPMFRRERPQKGRFRQFNQFGVEIFGRPDAACDAELIIMLEELRRELNLRGADFEINSIGDHQCRPAFRAALTEWGRAHLSELCEDCHQRLDRNPLRLLDCKIDVKLAQSAPTSLDYLCDPCRAHFDTVKELLTDAGVPFKVNPRLVRGLDYYTRTTFEMISTAVGSQSAVAAGGRYDGLVEALGGAPVAGSGFAIGVERIAMALERASLAADGGDWARWPVDAAIIGLGERAALSAMRLAHAMRADGMRVEVLSPERGLKALLRRADRIGARCALIIGDNEIARGVVQFRDLRASSQREIPDGEAAAAVAAARH